ncbi:hypothetical protein [Mesorhizobium sp. M7A.F.Ca.US.010.02.1.1]|uniref:hypothetical protein n=1 Tax=Mesorhizobium sp. M7A.F.Ca.US.010.02.1.1 TaxID=2496743 RepID=UPI000FEBC17E|nr:hypothetical protein [Mesorhizobium sp. M7A.F.Ca.US.010.02.1.1]
MAERQCALTASAGFFGLIVSPERAIQGSVHGAVRGRNIIVIFVLELAGRQAITPQTHDPARTVIIDCQNLVA